MKKNLQIKLNQYEKERRARNRWRSVVIALCSVVAIGTSYVLINPATTQTAEAFCGYEEHEHTDACYEKILICTEPEEGHKHTDACYEEVPELICELEETDGHAHDEGCYAEDGSVICGQEACEAHRHDDSCWSVTGERICGLEESEPHEHTDECYQINRDNLICGKEAHTHTLECFSDSAADVETEEEWAKTFQGVVLQDNWAENVIAIAETQLGYTESAKNYEVQEDGKTVNGITRYGQWYGVPYGDWCAMFCSFCIDYAGVDADRMPIDYDCQSWIETLSGEPYKLYRAAGSGYTPKPGDLIFLADDSLHTGCRSAVHVGFVSELVYDTKTDELTRLTVIEGNCGDGVCKNTYYFSDSAILGFGELPVNPNRITTIESRPASDGAVAVIKGNLPEGAEAVIKAITLSEDELIAYVGAEQAALMKNFVSYDIKIMADGKEWQPDSTVSVVVRQKELTAEKDESFGVAHVDGATSEVTAVSAEIADDGEIRFETDGFSLYIFFTVDFHYGDLTYSIDGMDSILLSELFKELGITLPVSSVAGVDFSDSTLLQVEQTAEGDWLLTSLAAFTTEETLTITLNDGNTLVIRVTDAQGGGGLGALLGNAVNPCDPYLNPDLANSWQVVTPYSGNAFDKKTASPVDLDGDGKTDAWLQKNVVPTGKENEFYVYLSLAKPIDAESYLKNAMLHVAATNNSQGLGSLSSSLPGSYKADMGPQTDVVDESALYVKIDIYDTATWNGSAWVGHGDHLAHMEGYRSFPGNVGCNNGSIYLQVNINGTIEYLKLANKTNLGKNDRGSGKPFQVTLGYDKLSNQGIFLDKTETVLGTVYDIVGSQIEFICDEASIIYSDGSVTYNNTDEYGNRILEWHPQDNLFDPIFVGSQPYKGIYNNVSQLVYKVRLKTEEEGFNSCADNMNSRKEDAESYKVNESATLSYSRISLAGADPTHNYDGGSALFEVPYVRGLLYDLRFLKVSQYDDPLSGAVFRFADANKSPMLDKDGNPITYTSGVDGYVNIANEPILPVYLKEITPPPGCDLPQNPFFGPLKQNWTTAGSTTPERSRRFVQDLKTGCTDNMLNIEKGNDADPWKIENELKLVDIRLKKVDSGGDLRPIAGAQFDLYREVSAAEPGCIAYTDESGTHYLLKINADPLISGSVDPIEIKDLHFGQYYLFETKAPDGYIPLTGPVKFELKADAIVTSDENAEVDSNDPLLLKVKNSSGYEMPHTGGPGTFLFTLCGILLMSTALMYGCMLRRKRERRTE